MAALFRPFRALGYITEATPFAVQRLGSETFVVVSVGQAWQIFNCAKLSLAVVGPELPGTILALAAQKELTFAAVGNAIFECKRTIRSGEYKGHKRGILQLLVLGEILLSLGRDGDLVTWRIGEHAAAENRIELGADFRPTCMAHPATYLNKVVVGGACGRLQLWNFATGRLLYAFDLGRVAAVRCVEPSPALDVVGVGLADGNVVLHNLKYDEEVASFVGASGVGVEESVFADEQPNAVRSRDACTAIAFRTGNGVPLMAAGGGVGALTVWNLEERRVHCIVREAHGAPLAALHFFAGEPRLLSAGADNALKQWLFDGAGGAARLLRFRAGHSAPPTVVRHYGDGNRLLSAGQDRAFRMFSVIQDQQSRELSQGRVGKKARKLGVEATELKLPRLIAMDACQVRERDWANVITAHAGDAAAYTWRLQNFHLGEHVLQPPAPSSADDAPSAPVSAVALSACGNFGFVGLASGRLDRYNMQSGLHRGAYRRADSDDGSAFAHDGSVAGLAAEAGNRKLVSVGHDCALRVWELKRQVVRLEIDVGSRPTRLAARSGSALVATASDDHILRMFDIETGRKVRTFAGHRDRVTDLAISHDNRWLLSSSMDGSLRVWDIPSAHTLQVVVLGAPVTSFSLAPGQELLATTHANRKGIYLWANQYIYRGAADIVPSERPVHAVLPSLRADTEDAADEEGSGSDSDESTVAAAADRRGAPEGGGELAGGARRHASGAPLPLEPRLATLSMLPRAQWHNLAHLDAIKERSKPTEPAKKPEAAPFFLPTVAGLGRNPVFDVEAEAAPANGNLPGWEEDGTREDGAPNCQHSDATAADDAEAPPGKKQRGKKRREAAQAAQAGLKRSRVLLGSGADAGLSDFCRLLREGAAASDFGGFVALLRGMSAVAVDRQLQSMRVVDLASAEPEALLDLGRLMQCVEGELAAGRSFEHAQALLRAFLRIHGEAVSEDPGLRDQAAALERSLSASWLRLQGKLRNVRCLVNFLGNLPS